MEGIMPGQYLPGDSAFHRLDPRTKIIAGLGAMLAALAANGAGLAVTAGLVGAGLAVSRITLPVLWRQVRALVLIITVTVLIQTFLTPGEALLEAGPVRVSAGGLLAGLDLLARLVLIIAAGIVLTSTTSTLSLAAGMESLLGPLGRLGVPVHEAVMAVTIAVGFVPVVFEEAATIMRAQISRGAGFYGPGPARRVKAVVSLMVPLLVGAFRRCEELATAMEARCYRGGSGRTRMRPLKFSASDLACLLLCGAGLAVVLALRALPGLLEGLR